MCLIRPFKDLRLDGAAMMFGSLSWIQLRDLPPMSFLLKPQWNILGNCPSSDLNDSRADVMDVEDKDDIP